MARKVINYTTYTFTPGASGVGQIVIPQYIPRERMILITNVTQDLVILNFSDPSRLASSYSATVTGATGSTTVVFSYNTSAMSSTDKIQILVDEYAERVQPVEELYDPVGKQRVSTPQSLIDTDFEYGNQISKWEQLGATNYQANAFQVYPPITYTTVTGIIMTGGQRVVVVSSTVAHGLAIGTPVTVMDTFFSPANGNFVIETVPTTTSFTYSAKSVNTTNPVITNILDPNKSLVYVDQFYSNANTGTAPTVTLTGTLVTVTTSIPHGLSMGNEIAVSGITGTNPPNGNFFVSTVYNPTNFAYVATSGTPSALTTTSMSFTKRNQALFAQRAFDGGVIFSANSYSNNQQAIRQTRRNFHYQSGKGLEMATGTIMKPSYTMDYLSVSGGTANNTNIIVQTREVHNLTPGTSVTIIGVTTSGYNGTYNVASVLNSNQFTYVASGIPASTPGAGVATLSVNSWYGAVQRTGLFNQENGLFFEFDGQQLYAVIRNSVKQITGRVTVTSGSTAVTQTDANYSTEFSKQLTPGQYIVIRGTSYKVQDIASDTSLTLATPYRGITASYATISTTIDTKYAQNTWNIDRLDGTGPSGYKIDLTKMQMWYVDYSWYGAGFVRWGVRTTDGQIQFCHKVANNNVNTAAYMRSGNLPGRYETSTLPPVVTAVSGILATDTTIYTTSTLVSGSSTISAFPPSGTLTIHNGTVVETVNYTSVTSGGFSGLTRAVTGVLAGVAVTMTSGATTGTVSTTSGVQIGQRVVLSSGFPDNTFVTGFVPNTSISFSNASYVANPTVVLPPMSTQSGQPFALSTTNPTVVELAYPTYSPWFSHWGTAVTMDGGFDQDKNLLFTYGQTTPITIASGVTKALFSVRIAPSVDSGLINSFIGARELVNRVQLQPQTIDVSTLVSGVVTWSNFLVRAYLNATPQLISGGTMPTWVNVVSGTANPNSSLAQIADYTSVPNGVTVSGGEVTAGFFVNGTLSTPVPSIRDLGNSILSASSTQPNTGIYPDGPDTLTIVVTNLGQSSNSVFGRMSWVEPQA